MSKVNEPTLVQREPARAAAVVAGVVGVTLALALAFGLPVTVEQSTAILAAVPVYVGAIVVMTEWIRSRVKPVATIEADTAS